MKALSLSVVLLLTLGVGVSGPSGDKAVELGERYGLDVCSSGSSDCFLPCFNAAFHTDQCRQGKVWSCALAFYYSNQCTKCLSGDGGGTFNACPYGGSTEPSAHDCWASGGYVVSESACRAGEVCCEWMW
jgi:hypothetical protein